MFDMLKTLQKLLLKNATIAQHCKGRIRAYTLDETVDTNGTLILIIPLNSPKPSTFASDTSLTSQYLYQINVRGTDRDNVQLISEEVKNVLWNIDFKYEDGTDEYDVDKKLYEVKNRYRGNPYTIDALRHLDKDV